MVESVASTAAGAGTGPDCAAEPGRAAIRALEAEDPQQAGRAYTRAIALGQNRQAARRARRGLGLAAGAAEAALAAAALRDRLGLAEEPRLLSAGPVAGGLAANVDAIARYRFATPAGEHMVIAKTLVLRPDAGPDDLPPPVAVHMRLGEGVIGGLLRFPRFHGWHRRGRGGIYLMEEVPGRRPDFAAFCEALGVLASGAALAAQAPLADWLASDPPQRPAAPLRPLRRIAEALPGFRPGPLRRRLAGIEALAEGAAPLPPALAHGDAQQANAVLLADGTLALIDLGTMGLRPPGFDLARAVFLAWLAGPRTADAFARRDAAGFAAFGRGLARMGEHPDPARLRAGVRLGLAAHLRDRLRLMARALREADPVARDRIAAQLALLEEGAGVALAHLRGTPG